MTVTKKPVSEKTRKARLAKRATLRDELAERVTRGDVTLPEAVRLIRRITGRTQLSFAQWIGVSPRILTSFERGQGNPTLRTLEKMLAPFGLEVGVRWKSHTPRSSARGGS